MWRLTKAIIIRGFVGVVCGVGMYRDAEQRANTAVLGCKYSNGSKGRCRERSGCERAIESRAQHRQGNPGRAQEAQACGWEHAHVGAQVLNFLSLAIIQPHQG